MSYVVLEGTDVVAYVDESYRGPAALTDAGFEGVPIGPSFDTTPGQYRALLKSDLVRWRVR